MRVVIALALWLLLFLPQIVAQQNPASAPAASDVMELESDLRSMRSLLAQMEANLPFVQSTEAPLKHQFELEIAMWKLLITNMQQRLTRMQASHYAAAPALPKTAAPVSPPSADTRYNALLENEYLRASRLDLPGRAQAPIYQNVHDVVWIAISDAAVTFTGRDQQHEKWQFRAGDARIFPRDQVRAVRNDGVTPFQSVVVELKRPGLISSGCGCTSQAERAVCGCGQDQHVPALWAVGVGGLTLSGTTLAAGQAFENPAPRGDSLLVAITPLELRDGDAGAALTIPAGQALWLKAGVHRLQNVSQKAARFVSLEF